MSDEAAVIDAPATAPAEESSFGAEAEARFEAAKEKVQGTAHNAVMTTEDPNATARSAPNVKPPKDGKGTATEPTSDIPEQFLTGEKPEEKKDDAPKESGDEELDSLLKSPSPGKSAASVQSWERMQHRLSKENGEKVELQKKVAALEKIAATKALDGEEVKKWKGEVQKAQELVERVAFEKSPRIQRMNDLEKQAMDGAKIYVKGTEIDASVIDGASHVTGNSRIKVLTEAGLDADQRAAILARLERVDDIRSERNSMLENHKEFIAQHEAQERAKAEQTKAEEAEHDKKVFESSLEELRGKMEPFQKVEGNDKWNAAVDKRIEEARSFFSGDMPLDQMAKIALAGVATRVYADMAAYHREQNKSLKAQIAKLTAGQPSGGETTNGQQSTFRASNDATSGPELDAARTREFEQAAVRVRQ